MTFAVEPAFVNFVRARREPSHRLQHGRDHITIANSAVAQSSAHADHPKFRLVCTCCRHTHHIGLLHFDLGRVLRGTGARGVRVRERVREQAAERRGLN